MPGRKRGECRTERARDIRLRRVRDGQIGDDLTLFKRRQGEPRVAAERDNADFVAGPHGARCLPT
jgi:hypothetical protein